MDTTTKQTIHIVTHDGSFHADEIFAIATLRIIFKDSDIIITRTRDEDIIDSADIVVDVGGVYDPISRRFDHHQKEGAGIRQNGIPYASFGLIWSTYGSVVSSGEQHIADVIDKTLVQSIDALDNGVALGEYKSFFGDIGRYDIADFVDAFKPLRDEKEEQIYKKFMYVVGVAQELIKAEISSIKDMLDNDREIREIILKNKDKTLLILDKYYYTGNVGLLSNTTLLVVSRKRDSTWIVESVRDNPKTFENRIRFPDEWLGKRDKELQEITGLSDAIFCHKGGFMIVTQSKESALLLAHKVLQDNNISQ